MSLNFNKARVALWGHEMFRVFDIYEEFLTEFGLNLYSCSMERISFCNNKFFFHIGYSYDKYQMERNTEMPLAMIVFGNGRIEKNIIDVFKEKISSVDVYNELRVLNEETNDQSLTYQRLLKKYLVSVINKNQLF